MLRLGCIADQSFLQYGVVVFRGTALDDKGHVEFAQRFGELDDVKPYTVAGRKHRLKYEELFDVSNVDADGTLVDPESPRGQASKVCGLFIPLKIYGFWFSAFCDFIDHQVFREIPSSMWIRASTPAELATLCC